VILYGCRPAFTARASCIFSLYYQENHRNSYPRPVEDVAEPAPRKALNDSVLDRAQGRQEDPIAAGEPRQTRAFLMLRLSTFGPLLSPLQTRGTFNA
jgi:hypothetical protein